ncbi:MAG TPA: SMP-30/gluconolactonase/LRE family protein [Bryobacteraceae bacterium]|jgi:gluconolactonase
MKGVIPLTVILLAGGAAFAQDFSDIRVETIARDVNHAEGPVWSLDGFLLFSDTVTDRIEKWAPGKGVSEFASRAGGANGNAYDEQGRLYTCEFRERRVTRTAKNGRMDVLASRYEGKRLNAPDDIVVRRDGNVYFTDPAFGNQQDSRELDFYGVFRITGKGELEPVAKWTTRPNGIALSPNGRLLYVADSDARSVHVFDLDRGGSASNDRVFIPKVEGVPGGLRTDEKGNLYVAAKYLSAYSPRGELLHDIHLSQSPTNLTFGDPDFSTLYITARNAVYRVRIGVKGALQYAAQVP